jgi:type IV pilus assembly protein PilM
MAASRPEGTRVAHGFRGALARAFPTPQILTPRTAGIDISDASIKWVVLEGPGRGSLKLAAWGELALAPNIIQAGIVQDVHALSNALRDVAAQVSHVHAVHAALPEESAFVFNMNVPRNSSRDQVLNLIEFELDTRVPIPPAQAIYDFNPIPGDSAGEEEEVGVVVFPRDLAESYTSAFTEAGLSLLSLELEARSIARAVVVDSEKEPVVLVVDFGGTRTGLAVVKRGVPIFSSTVEIGGNTITNALLKETSIKPDLVDAWKNERGLDATVTDPNSQKALEAISGLASSLGDEIAKHYRYWDTRRDESGARMSPVSRVLLVGGSSNLFGLPEYVSSRVQAPASRPNVWQFVSSFDTYIPPLDAHIALQYATAIGLALRSF